MNLKEAGIDVGLAIAGLFGAVLMTSKNSAQSIAKTTLSLVGGSASANYITPLLLKITHLGDDPQYSYAMAFLLGFAGLRAIEIVSTKFFPDEQPPVFPNRNKRSR
jgi:hypothetical protein